MLTTTKTASNLTGLRAFHGDKERQKKIITRVRLHEKHDEILQGATGQNGKWCAVGCAIDDYSHYTLAQEMQIPISLVFADENVFEGSAVAYANKWPLRFVTAPKLGADCSLVPHQLYVWLLVGTDSPYLELIKKADTLEMMRGGAALVQKYIDGETTDSNQWDSLSKRAREASARASDEYWSALRDLRDLSALRALRDQYRKFVARAGDKLLQLMADAPVAK